MSSSTIASIIISGLIISSHGQVLSPPTGGGTTPSNPASTSNSSGNDTVTRIQPSSTSPHGEEVPLIDPTQKTVTFQGRTYSLLDNNLGGQFEAYLASSSYKDAEAIKYRENIQSILNLLSPTAKGGPNLRSAYDLLEETSEYPGDGNICNSLANSIYAALLIKQGKGTKEEAVRKLQQERDRIIRNMSIVESKLDVHPAGKEKRPTRVESVEFTAMKKRVLEIEASIKKFQIQGTVSLTQSKIQYQAMIIQLFAQRRFEHVIIASRFYNLVYRDGNQKMQIKKGSDTEQFFSGGIGVNPTVAGIDAAANEAIRKIRTLVDAFHNNIKNNRIHGASERLVEAYAIGEFITVVQTIPMDEKSKIQQYVQDGNDLVEALSSKDLTKATKLNESLKQQARDYNSSKAESYINAHKQGSDSFVRDAKFALLEKQTDKFKVAMESAIKMWPGNPAIAELNKRLDDRITGMTQDQDEAGNIIKEFDNLLSAKSYRSMIEEPLKSKFVVVLGKLNDTERLNSFNEIATSMQEIEKALEKAKSLEAAGQPHAAWEAVYEAQIKYFDDPLIANAKSRLSGEVATFTNALTRANTLEQKDSDPQNGSAFSWYLQAQKIYPNSEFAKKGIQRLIDKEFQ